MGQEPRRISLRDIEAVFSVERDCESIKIRFDMPGKGMALAATLSPGDAIRIGQELHEAGRRVMTGF